MELRLTTPLNSHSSAPGTGFESVVVSSRGDGGKVFLPPGTIVRGEVRKRKSVGYGIVHERAMLELEFQEYQLPDGQRFPLEAKLHSLDNARESVNQNGTIRGVLAARTPHSFLLGVWHKPSVELFQRSFIGLTGCGGKLFTELSMGPIGAAAIFAVRTTMFRMAEPEIQLPPGTEMRIDLVRVTEDAPAFEQAPDMLVDEEFAAWLKQRPVEVRKAGGRLENDIVNLVFVGSRQQLAAAFQAAGWSEADRMNLKSIQRAYMAFNKQAGYATAPTSKLYYEERLPDVVFQKSLDTMSKRHHIRVWRTMLDGEEIWLGAATHDIGIAFKEGSFTHRIHPKIDYERGKIVDDLKFTGCIDGVGYVDRPKLEKKWDDRAGIVTDGRLAVVQMSRQCEQPDASSALATSVLRAPKSGASGLARRMVLEGRNYVLRSNPYYMVYDAWKWRKSGRERMEALRAE